MEENRREGNKFSLGIQLFTQKVKQIYTKSALKVVFLVVLSLLKTQKKRALNGMIDKIEFTAKNLLPMREFCYSLIIQRNREYLKISLQFQF